MQLATAQAAAAIINKIDIYTQAIADIDTVINGNWTVMRATISAAVDATASATSMQMELTPEIAAKLFAKIRTTYQTDLDTLTAQLAALT